MPNLLPGAIWQPIDVGNRAARRKGRGVIGHVSVTASKNLRPGPLATRPSDWHFYLPKVGPPFQQIDMDLQCWSSGAGNATCVAWECEGGLGSSATLNAEPLTDNQVFWAARILRHLHDTEGVPIRAMTSSLPTERGQGWHRLGITHSLGVGAVPGWRVVGGELWSSSVGKECPGNRKIEQLRTDVVRLAGATATEEDIVASINDLRVAIREESGPAVWRGYPITGRDVDGNLGKGVTAPEMLLASIAHDVLKAPIPNARRRAQGEAGAMTNVAAQIEWIDSQVAGTQDRLAVIEAKIDQIVNALLPPGKG